jgi:hypothetical protein
MLCYILEIRLNILAIGSKRRQKKVNITKRLYKVGKRYTIGIVGRSEVALKDLVLLLIPLHVLYDKL